MDNIRNHTILIMDKKTMNGEIGQVYLKKKMSPAGKTLNKATPIISKKIPPKKIPLLSPHKTNIALQILKRSLLAIFIKMSIMRTDMREGLKVKSSSPKQRILDFSNLLTNGLAKIRTSKEKEQTQCGNQ